MIRRSVVLSMLTIAFLFSHTAAAPRFPSPLPTPCDNFPRLDKRPGFKQEGKRVYFQWVAAQAQMDLQQWCKYYGVRNLHSSANLSFRWPTANLEEALLDPDGIVEVMTTPVRPSLPKDNDPIYYGAVFPGPSVTTTVFQAQLSSADYPGRIILTVNGRGIGGGGPQFPGINLTGLEFSSRAERAGAVTRYSVGYRIVSANYREKASISWWPTDAPQFVEAVKRQYPQAQFGDPVPLDDWRISTAFSARKRAQVRLIPARVFRGDQVVLVINVPVLVPER